MATTTTTQKQRPDSALIHAAIVIIVGVLATTLAQTQLLGRLPLQNLLKNELHADRTANAAFFFWVGLPWYFKPFAGILTDAFPLLGSRRRSYILISAGLGTLAWYGLAFTPHDYSKLLYVSLVINTFMVVASTVVGGYMVEVAQANSGSGRLAAVRNFVQQACYIINGPVAGTLASIAFGWTAAACGSILFLLVPATVFFLKEQKRYTDSDILLAGAYSQLGKIASARTMWAAAGLSALFYLAPGLATATFYRQQNELHMNTEAQGLLQFLSGIAGVSAALAYGYACRHWNLRRLLQVCLLIATVANVAYVLYTTPERARIIETFNGFGYTLAELALMDLAIRATPAGSEGLGFSLMMSVRNLALFGTDWFGSRLMDQFHIGYNSLVYANTATTLMTVPLVLLLPKLIVGRRDAQA